MKLSKGGHASSRTQKTALIQTLKLAKYNYQNREKNNHSKVTLKQSK